jgi:hypothetical protein
VPEDSSANAADQTVRPQQRLQRNAREERVHLQSVDLWAVCIVAPRYGTGVTHPLRLLSHSAAEG